MTVAHALSRPGSIVFAADLAVTGDVTADDDVTINGLDVSEVAAIANGTRRHTLRFSRAVTIAGNWTVTGDVRIHSVNGYELDRLDEVFWTQDGDQVGHTTADAAGHGRITEEFFHLSSVPSGSHIQSST